MSFYTKAQIHQIYADEASCVKQPHEKWKGEKMSIDDGRFGDCNHCDHLDVEYFEMSYQIAGCDCGEDQWDEDGNPPKECKLKTTRMWDMENTPELWGPPELSH